MRKKNILYHQTLVKFVLFQVAVGGDCVTEPSLKKGSRNTSASGGVQSLRGVESKPYIRRDT